MYGESNSNCIPLVFLHGTNGNGNSTFGHIYPKYASDRPVIIVDYAGCGESSLPNTKLNIELLVSQILAILNDSGYDKFDIIGHSLGSVVAAAFASKYPQYTNKLVLSAPWCNAKDSRHQLIFQAWKALEETAPKLSMSFALSHVFSPSFLSTMNEKHIRSICNQTNDPYILSRIGLGLEVNIIEYLKSIESETLVIGLKYDSLIPTYLVKETASFIKNCEYIEIASGHAVQIENPRDWNMEVHNFL